MTGPAVWTSAVSFVLASAAVAAWEGTFWPVAVTMGFVNHGGMWSDILILPVVAGIIVPQLPALTAQNAPGAAVLVLCAAAITTTAHAIWYRTAVALHTTDHVFPSYASGKWYEDLSMSGAMHLVFMTAQLVVLFAYALSPMPRVTVGIVTLLLTLHLPLAQIQPGWYTTGQLWSWRTMGPTLMSTLACWIVGVTKWILATPSSG